jgi:large subunit ribosomal protein L21
MFAVIKSGGKQYRVAQGDVLALETLAAAPGEEDELPVLLLGDPTVTVGTPLVAGATVRAEVMEQGRHRKVHVYKFKAKSRQRKHIGHRQQFTRVRITEIVA